MGPPDKRKPGATASAGNLETSATTTDKNQINACRCGVGEVCACPACTFYRGWRVYWPVGPSDTPSQIRRRQAANRRLTPLVDIIGKAA